MILFKSLFSFIFHSITKTQFYLKRWPSISSFKSFAALLCSTHWSIYWPANLSLLKKIIFTLTTTWTWPKQFSFGLTCPERLLSKGFWIPSMTCGKLNFLYLSSCHSSIKWIFLEFILNCRPFQLGTNSKKEKKAFGVLQGRKQMLELFSCCGKNTGDFWFWKRLEFKEQQFLLLPWASKY